MWANVTTDGSCVFLQPQEGASRGSGGWAAIVENGSDGWVLRGRVPETTSTRMELYAVIEGLRSLPSHIPVRVRTDSTLVIGVFDRWQRGRPTTGPFTPRRKADMELWRDLSEQFDRFAAVDIVFVQRKDQYHPHQRAHKIAKAEARALANGVEGELPLPEVPRNRARTWFIERDPLRAAENRLRRNLLDHEAARRVQARRRASSF